MQPDASNFADTLRATSAQAVGQTLPSLFGALVILFAGYMLATALERLTERWLRRPGPTRRPQLAKLVFWLVMVAVILIAANALGLDSRTLTSTP